MKKMNFIKKENKKFALLSMLFLVLSCSNKTGNNSESTNSTTEQQKTVSPEELKKYTKNAAQTQDAFVGVHNSVKDSIVNIRTKKTVTVNTYNPLEELLYGRSGGQEKRESGSLGSGFVVSKDGYVVTNNHVIDGADEIYVKFSNGREYRTKLVGTSPEVDIAVLKIDSNETFKPLEFANSDQVQIGQWSIAFGNPLGLNDSMTVGIVSAAGRSSLGIEEIENFIQTDAAINQGNSGGPLIDITGKVIGVNTAIYSQSGGSVGIGFAIPANLVTTVKDSIIATGKFEKPYIGIYLGNLDADKVKALNLKSSNGVFIAGTVPNGPAAAAGITKNDIITAVDGKEVNSAGAFVGEIAAKKVGQSVKLTISRNGKTSEVSVTLAKTPNAIEQQRIMQQKMQQQQQLEQEQFGR
ncbi:trypsin-like peptidase domain-containing protein [Leptotrichia sp. oral taxon 417]|jgi:protease degQ|uniref:S1C family serine protease n=1 Tax=Leptotrichia sp. oral taxon 417 TaxID=712365 RepID=UPI0015B7DDC2|nr:trypsin-like peptidase domain-containing protein [Leptotrichia sp. oral taxon 417]NWO26249.1 trypsin-like peptidase domain-containing protein [Leptotrichia sp. oral taxon 417]